MANFCGKCGTRLDPQTGLCPNCDEPRRGGKKKQAGKWVVIGLPILILLALVPVFGGKGLLPCRHQWAPADCTQAETCSRCGAVRGEPLGHSPGEPRISTDPVLGRRKSRVTCTRCGLLLDSGTEALDTLTEEGEFLFTPHEFLDRYSALVRDEYGACDYEIGDSEQVMMVDFHCGDGQDILISFLHPDLSGATREEWDERDVYCVSIYFFAEKGNSDSPRGLEAFFKACDPELDEDGVDTVLVLSLAALQNAYDQGDYFGNFQYHELTYEVVYLSTELSSTAYENGIGFSVHPAGTDRESS